ncbi:hypothetical protein CYMTET_25775 [Cymbomonas tetramitiformis]|uniref:RanBP2-type domain-containing protein n=1 Tax=Cymbomonas tetramitiformis TaxID=36881 RepID=A0AAE0KYP9_9CHLO|nr:hypothetical protein CYMTET_25775 [Cymbomonas tetramitiformis]
MRSFSFAQNTFAAALGHPLCHFCNKRFFSEAELFTHMQRGHETCHICQRANPTSEEARPAPAERHLAFGWPWMLHLARSRIRALRVRRGGVRWRLVVCEARRSAVEAGDLCEEPECLRKGFIVFQSDTDMKRHMAQEHSDSMTKQQRRQALNVPVNFNFRSYREEHSDRFGPNRRGGGGSGGGGAGSDGAASSSVAAPSHSGEPVSEHPNEVQAPDPTPAELAGLGSQAPMAASGGGRWASAAGSANATQRSLAGGDNFPALPTMSKNQKKKQRAQERLQQEQAGGAAGPSSASPAGSSVTAPPGAAAAAAAAIPQLSAEELKEANRAMVEKMKRVLGKDNASGFSEFREVSAAFRHKQISAAEYHKHIEQLGLVTLVPDLTALLPDATLRSELAAVHRSEYMAPKAAAGPSAAAAAPPGPVAFPPPGGPGPAEPPPPASRSQPSAKEPKPAKEPRTVAQAAHSLFSNDPSSLGVWVCQVCTLHNTSSSRHCSVCLTVRPMGQPSGSDAATNGNGAAPGQQEPTAVEAESAAGKKGKKSKKQAKFERLRLTGGDAQATSDFLDNVSGSAGNAWGESAPAGPRRVNPQNSWSQGQPGQPGVGRGAQSAGVWGNGGGQNLATRIGATNSAWGR